MMMVSLWLLSSFIIAVTRAQSVSAATGNVSTITGATTVIPTGSYLSLSSQVVLSSSAYPTMSTSNGTALSNSSSTSTGSSSSSSSSSSSISLLVATATTTSVNTSSTSSAATATNTQPCNNYPEFCNRKYSNITEVCAHNSAFVKADNAFSNQEIPIIGQLNDGIRMIQGEVHFVNETLYSCHSNCDFLNAGTYESELTIVRQWIEDNPYNVVTILIVNSDYAGVGNYTTPIINSGLLPYVYYPPKQPMELDDWPTLGQMILTGKRAVVFMDYEANQTAVPYVLDQFSQMWETPFSPIDPAFPCDAQRPPGITDEQAKNRLYLANHNLNVDISIGGSSLLIPNFADLAEVNAVSGNASLGLMSNNCRSDWDRAPNFLLVDYYNYGNGSVFEVAAQMNNVTYNRECCGTDTVLDSGAAGMARPATFALILFATVVAVLSSI